MAISKEQFLAYRSPEALTGEFNIPDTEITICIEGTKAASARKRIQDNIIFYTDALKKLGWNNRPVSVEEITSAAWATECVKLPSLTFEEWITFGQYNLDEVQLIAYKCMLFSRLIKEDVKEAKDGIESAVLEHNEGAANGDPLDGQSSDSA